MSNQGQRIVGDNLGTLRTEYQNGRLIVSKNTIDIMLAGIDDKGKVVIKISPDTIDVKTATDDQLIFNSAQDIFKIVATNTAVLPGTAAATSGSPSDSNVDINTGIKSTTGALIPFAFYITSDGSEQIPYMVTMPPTSGFGGLIAYRVDCQSYINIGTVHINITATNFVGNATSPHTVRWYLLQETAGV